MDCDVVERILKLNEAVISYHSSKKGKDKVTYESEKSKFEECLRFYLRNGLDIEVIFEMISTAIIDILTKEENAKLNPITVSEIAKLFKKIAHDYVDLGYTRAFEFLKKEAEKRY